MPNNFRSLLSSNPMCPLCEQALIQERSIVAFIVISASAVFFGLWMVMWRDSSSTMSAWREEVFMKTGGLNPVTQLIADIDQKEDACHSKQLLTFHPTELMFAETLQSVCVSCLRMRAVTNANLLCADCWVWKETHVCGCTAAYSRHCVCPARVSGQPKVVIGCSQWNALSRLYHRTNPGLGQDRVQSNVRRTS